MPAKFFTEPTPHWDIRMAGKKQALRALNALVLEWPREPHTITYFGGVVGSRPSHEGCTIWEVKYPFRGMRT